VRNFIFGVTTSFILLFTLVVEVHAVTGVTQSELNKYLVMKPVMRGSFVQQKKIAVLKKPLFSSGVFVASEKQGLYWQQKSPFLSETIVTHDFLAQRIKQGEVNQYTFEEQPLLVGISRIFLAIWKGDMSVLNMEFESTINFSDNKWKMVLVPTNKMMKKMISKIVVQGSEYIEQVRLHESNGNLTDISITGVTGSDKLLKNESGLFSWP